MARREVVERFWAKVEKTGTCWLWSGRKTQGGYGQFGINGVPVYAHRFSWELHNSNKIQKGKHVCHSCDNPPCVRPDHIWLGTPLQNMRDCIRKGRMRHPRMVGEQIGVSKLTDQQVREIRAKYKTIQMLAEEYGVSEGTIHFILKRQTWTHV